MPWSPVGTQQVEPWLRVGLERCRAESPTGYVEKESNFGGGASAYPGVIRQSFESESILRNFRVAFFFRALKMCGKTD